MIQSLLEEHSHAMMLKHYPTKHVLSPLNQYSAMGPFFFLLSFFFFPGEEKGALRCAGHAWRPTAVQVMWDLLLCVNAPLPSRTITATTAKWKERDGLMSTERQVFCVSNCGLDRCVIIMAAAPHRRSHRDQLTCPSPAKRSAHTGQRRPLDPPSRRSSSASPVFCTSSLFLFKIMVVFADCFTCLTDSSGSGWLLRLTHGHGLSILTALLTHLVTSDPSTWLS